MIFLGIKKAILWGVSLFYDLLDFVAVKFVGLSNLGADKRVVLFFFRATIRFWVLIFL